jgi:hypothetical protein
MVYHISMDQQWDEQRFIKLEEKVDQIHVSVEKIRKYFLVTTIINLVLFVLPLIGLVFAIPMFLKTLDTVAELGV